MNPEEKKNRIHELTDILNEASRAYYQEGREIMPNIEYDALYDELLSLENETGFLLSDSPTQNVGYEIISELPKERHESPMLSLNKTKSADELVSWMNGREAVLSWKLDGITIVLSYEGGRLVKAVTRGNGEIGEVVTQNARRFSNLPLNIPFAGKLVIRGEAIITYSDFEKINEEMGPEAAKYKNPRNLCSGSVRQLDPHVTAQRHVRLIAFSLISADGAGTPDFHDSFSKRMDWLSDEGFETVGRVLTNPARLKDDIEDFKRKIPDLDFPSDGLVLCYEDTVYGRSLGRTAKFPRDSIAFKWQDELEETTVRGIEWSCSRTGLINPVAVFDPVELEGTTVTRASVHNVSIVEELMLGKGDRVTVYKANMIIPQISENLTKAGPDEIPKNCPVCGGPTRIQKDNASKLLFCLNPDCPAKKIKSFELMASRSALNIEGLSEMTLGKFIDHGFIKEYADLFGLIRYRDDIAVLEGFGEKSADNICEAAERARDTELYRFLYGLGIPGIGLAAAKQISKAAGEDPMKLMELSGEELTCIRDIGPVTASNFDTFMKDGALRGAAERLMKELRFKTAEEEPEEKIFEGLNFVITGELETFANREEAKNLIEKLGGKVTGSVSAKTDYLINNDIESSSSKNRRAGELHIPVVTEEEFLRMLPGGYGRI